MDSGNRYAGMMLHINKCIFTSKILKHSHQRNTNPFICSSSPIFHPHSNPFLLADVWLLDFPANNFITLRMLNNKAKDIKNPYHQVSLPKTTNPAYNTNSTRCMSVSKPEIAKTPLLTPIPIKPMVPPKQLTVPFFLASTTSARETTRAWSDE